MKLLAQTMLCLEDEALVGIVRRYPRGSRLHEAAATELLQRIVTEGARP